MKPVVPPPINSTTSHPDSVRDRVGAESKVSSHGTIVIALLGGLLALVTRWYFVTHARVLQPLDLPGDWGDAGEYYRYAWNLVHHGVFSFDLLGTASPQPDSYRDPGYPVFLAAWMLITDSYESWYAGVLLSHAVLGGIAVTCCLLALRDALPRWLLALGGIVMAVWPHSVAIAAYVMSENLAAALYAIAAALLSESVRRGSGAIGATGGVTLAAAGLTNSVLAPLFLPLMLGLGWKRMLPRRIILVVSLAATLPIVGWAVRGSLTPGDLKPITRVHMNLVQGSWPTYHAAMQLKVRHDPVGIQTMDAINHEIFVMHDSTWQGIKLMLDRMSRAPGTYAYWYLGKPALLWGWEIGLGAGGVYVVPTANSPFIDNTILRAVYGVAYILNGVLALVAMAGAATALARRTTPVGVLMFAITGIWITIIYGVLQSDPRYSIPFRGLEIGLACYAVACLTSYLATRQRDRSYRV